MKASILYDYVRRFYIQPTATISFWAPYINNLDFTQRDNAPRGLGKSSPSTILKAARLAVKKEPLTECEHIKTSLVSGYHNDPLIDYKGTDCSGFIYHVLGSYSSEVIGISFDSTLSLPKKQVLNGAFNLKEWSDAYTLTTEEADSLPDDVPLTWVVEHFKRKPENLCSAKGLVSGFSSQKIASIDELKTGDIIFMSADNSDVPHVTLVLEYLKDRVMIAHSTRKDPSDTGGVIVEELVIKDGAIKTEDMYSPHNIESFHRPKALTLAQQS